MAKIGQHSFWMSPKYKCLHFASSAIWVPAYIIERMNITNQVILFAFEDDFFAIWTNPWILVLFEKCLKFSINFIVVNNQSNPKNRNFHERFNSVLTNLTKIYHISNGNKYVPVALWYQ